MNNDPIERLENELRKIEGTIQKFSMSGPGVSGNIHSGYLISGQPGDGCFDTTVPGIYQTLWPLSSPITLNDNGVLNDIDSFPTESPANEWDLAPYSFNLVARNNADCSDSGFDTNHQIIVAYQISFSAGVWTVGAICYRAGSPADNVPLFNGSMAGIDPYTVGSVVVPNTRTCDGTSVGFGGNGLISFTHF